MCPSHIPRSRVPRRSRPSIAAASPRPAPARCRLPVRLAPAAAARIFAPRSDRRHRRARGGAASAHRARCEARRPGRRLQYFRNWRASASFSHHGIYEGKLQRFSSYTWGGPAAARGVHHGCVHKDPVNQRPLNPSHGRKSFGIAAARRRFGWDRRKALLEEALPKILGTDLTAILITEIPSP